MKDVAVNNVAADPKRALTALSRHPGIDVAVGM
jgi:hypothetical protein